MQTHKPITQHHLSARFQSQFFVVILQENYTVMNSLTSNIRFIGAEDENLDLFEGQYPIPNGISYNSYLIVDECVAVVDSVDVRRCADWLAAIEDSLGDDGSRPRYLIVQHVEPDHSGSIKALIDRYPDIRIVSTAKAAAMLANFFEDVDFAGRSHVVADGDTLSLGRTTLRFVKIGRAHV